MPGGVFSTAKLHGMTIRESATDGSDFSNPDADYRVLFVGEDGLFHLKDSAGTVTTPTGGAYTPGGTDVAVADGGTGASTAAGAATNLGLGTGDSPQFTAVNVGHATDTTVTRTGAGDLAVEGNALYRAGGTDVPIADGGTGASTATAGFDALSPMTTAGDLIIGGASGTRVRLAAGTATHVLTSNGAGSAPSWQAGGGGGSGAALGGVTYSTASDASWANSTSTTPADIDATNAILAITVPASGNIIVYMSLDFTTATANNGGYLWVRSGSTNHQSSAMIPGNVAAGGIGALTVAGGHATAVFYITGLTPGALTLKAGLSAIAGTVHVYANTGLGTAGNLASPFVMVAFAA